MRQRRKGWRGKGWGSNNSSCVFKNSGWGVPEFAGIEDEVGGVVSDGGAGFRFIDFVDIFSLVPDDFDPIANLQFGQIVEGIESSERIGPGDVAKTVGGEDDGQSVVLGGAEVGHPPDAGFEDLPPVVAFVDLAPDADFFNDEAVFFW
mgnify:CR=1 FL=1